MQSVKSQLVNCMYNHLSNAKIPDGDNSRAEPTALFAEKLSTSLKLLPNHF